MKTEMPDEIWVRPTHGAGSRLWVTKKANDGWCGKTKYVRADELETLRQENAALKEKLDFHTKVQPMGTTPDCGTPFIVIDNNGSALKVKRQDYSPAYLEKFHEDPPFYYMGIWCGVEYVFQRKDLKGWLPLPEGTEGL